MSHRLSIIIPCYNASETLEEAVDSVFVQELTIPFEIVMVDDGSTDGTRQVMDQLKKKYDQIICFYHDANKGGGAARNTGIKNSTGDLIFCLDSDNFFAPGILSKMIAYLDSTKAAGVVIEERRFFFGNNSKKYNAHFNKIIDRSIKIDDLFTVENGGILLDNFLFTRDAFLKTPGYPTHHGFDTQSFEYRFLLVNRDVRVCPGAVFYHRRRKDSYFQRVYLSQGISIGFYLIFEDILHLLSEKTRRTIINFDIFKKGKMGAGDFKQIIDIEFNTSPETFFIADKEQFMNEAGWDLFCTKFSKSTKPEDVFSIAVYQYRQQKYAEALEKFVSLVRQGVDSKIMYYNILRCVTALSGKEQRVSPEAAVLELMRGIAPEKQSGRDMSNLVGKLFRKLSIKK